ncbi:MAG: hypothetical protein OWU84_09790 [Firmicutes bacterium]|nr:hypothetical protein [Bacillota bacterium]
MTVSQYQEYVDILQRAPHIKRAEVVDDGFGGYQVQVVSQSTQPPRHVVREIVSLLRSAGWHDIQAGQVTVVQVQAEDDQRRSFGRLRIAGFAVSYGPSGYKAQCRLVHGARFYEGEGVAPTSILAVARATVAAVNEALGQREGLHLVEATQLEVAGVSLSVALALDLDGEVMAGNAVHRDTTAEETMIRAVLDAINRRFVLFTGQKV